MKQQRITEILERIRNVKAAVYGDFCLDAYWLLDPRGSEISVETHLKGWAVAKHYYSLGGASNIVANLAALEPKSIEVIGVIGDDIFGRELKRQLSQYRCVNTDSLVVQRGDFDTVTFAKPHLEARPVRNSTVWYMRSKGKISNGASEQRRIDFGFFNKRTTETDRLLLEGIRNALQRADVLIVNQQVPGSITNESFIDQASELFKEFDDKVVLLDSRHFGHKFRNIYRKTNDLEAAKLNGIDATIDDVITLADAKKYCRNLYRQFARPVFLTRGPRGIITVDCDGVHEVPGIQLLKKLDTVGAGDTVTSALALCLGAGVAPAEAAEFANFAAAVTVLKLFQTGTASGLEIIDIGKDADYIYQPELASDRRRARYFEDTEIEFCCESIPTGQIKHAVFDHDGTISTLRQGWEEIMAPMMIEAILGDEYKSADETLYHKVRSRVLDYIDKSTGIQTIIQMQALVEMVAEFGIVPPGKILDKFGYKEIYNERLRTLVGRRVEKFKLGRLDISDYTIKGALEFLNALRDRGIKLYLASGTDRVDVLAESQALGYAVLFDGGIYGAVGDITKYSKKMVIADIMTQNNLEGPELAVFGDGPVEIRECRKRDGLAVAIASDEIRRHGLNVEKRTRLVKAGAHIVAPDFSEYHRLLDILFNQ